MCVSQRGGVEKKQCEIEGKKKDVQLKGAHGLIGVTLKKKKEGKLTYF